MRRSSRCVHSAPGGSPLTQRDLATRFANFGAYWTGTPGRAARYWFWQRDAACAEPLTSLT
ncbi:hypothetical protein Acsp02_96620 [Actinoplanes sp. NBRC 103695]|nr:hypothetical protein Acsp02_96620 [Actinoplanes sp. NBRC 103695]